MGAPSKAYAVQLVKIQPEERLVAASELNFAPNSATNCREAKRMGYRAATQVKGLSPEINHCVGGRYCSYGSRQNSYVRNRQGYKSPTGSKTVARYQRDNIGTRETHSALCERACNNKSTNGKLLQKVLWESDQRIVVMKRGNARGAKGLAGEPMEQGHICRALTRIRDGNKIVSKTYNREALLKSRVRENLKHGSVRGFIASSDERNFRRRWL